MVHIIRSTGYFALIVGGLGIMGLSFNELFKMTNESKLAWDIFEDAKSKVVDHDSVKSVFGLPLVVYAQDASDYRIRNSLGYLHKF